MKTPAPFRRLRLLAAAIAVLTNCNPFVPSARADTATTNATASDFFLKKVHPLLEEKCFGCHGEAKDREAEFDMRTREGLLKGGESGTPALIPGDPEKSPMFRAVRRTEKVKMPPKERNKLNDGEIETLRHWILAGAPWTELSQVAKESKPKWEYKPEDIWAFQPLTNVAVPSLRTPIDAFILAKLIEKHISPAPPADRMTLIRRATFDLTGLPPTSEEIDSFVKDKSAGAFDKVIERLLTSPRYGEKQARHWLDVVRYADTDGYSNDYERPNAWRYRDYVIRSFNADKPYAQFILEQIAGDELAESADAALRTPSSELSVAVGMLRMGPWEQTAMSVAAVTRQQFLDDITHNVSATFLGLTVGCARCHDHKFDPIPTKDYYRLQSVFAPVQFEARKVEFSPTENTKGFDDEIARVTSAMERTKARLAAVRAKHQTAVKAYLKEKGVKALRNLPEAERPKRELGLTITDQGTEKVLNKRVEYLERELQRYQSQAFSVADGGLERAVPTPVLNVLIGGSLETPGDAVEPDVLMAVVHRGRPEHSATEKIIPSDDKSRRLALAKWIASGENPLTARVMVNRIWQWHFGEGLVETPNNFGKMGKKPTHPELLDWLANYFIEHGWSVKEMHRLIMRSAAYQRNANYPDIEALKKADPENKLLAHFHPRRLSAEELRDGMLAVSGELSTTMGGPPVYPEINLEAAIQPRHIMGSISPPYKPSPTREQRNRRTIYTVQIRSLMNPMLQVFNQPTPDFSCERRDETTVTPQVFALFNSQSAHDYALAMADRISRATSERSTQVEQVYRFAYGRLPTKQEKQTCLAHLEKTTEQQRKTKPTRFEFPKKVVQSMVEEFTGEPFEFEEDWDFSNYEYNLQPTDVTAETRALADLCLVILNSNEFVYVY